MEGRSECFGSGEMLKTEQSDNESQLKERKLKLSSLHIQSKILCAELFSFLFLFFIYIFNKNTCVGE